MWKCKKCGNEVYRNIDVWVGDDNVCDVNIHGTDKNGRLKEDEKESILNRFDDLIVGDDVELAENSTLCEECGWESVIWSETQDYAEWVE